MSIVDWEQFYLFKQRIERNIIALEKKIDEEDNYTKIFLIQQKIRRLQRALK